MIDMHCHVMPCIDDGSKNIEETFAIFENAATSGVTDMVMTPHYIKGTKYCYNNQSKQQILEVLREGIKRIGLDINIYYGNEVYIDPELPELVKNGEVATLAGSKYLLLELPVASEDIAAGNIIFKLKAMGITPIIAHPERYNYIQRHPERVQKYINLGCLLQGDYMSLLGRYGHKAQKTLKMLLKYNKIALLASDVHHAEHDYRLPEAYKKTKMITRSQKKVQELFIDNPEKIINNEEIKLD